MPHGLGAIDGEEGLDPNAALELPFDLTVERRAEKAAVVLQGELDLAAKDLYEQELSKLENQPPERLIVDLRGLTFIDSTGIKLLLRTLRDWEDNGADIGFVEAPDPVKSLLVTTGVAEQLPLVDPDQLD
jgi:anti-anti-sigma factor